MSLTYASQAVGQLAPFLLVAYLTTTLSADITEARERIENLAQTDALTGLYNLRMFNEVWQREHAACERDRGVYALLMIDMDKLKDINDAFGHDAGNSAITLVAQCLQRSIRNTDHAARFGGDEFAVLLGATPEIAEAVVKRVRHNVQDHPGSAVTHDPLQRQHRGRQLPQGFAGFARDLEHRRSQHVPRQGTAPAPGSEASARSKISNNLNVLDFPKNNGKVSAPSRRGVIDIWQFAVFVKYLRDR
jgi:diguanylate cyclase (GGDEF)-like protein